MDNTNIKADWVYKALRVLMYALLLTPLWVWSIFLFPFITSKILYFRILVELAVLCYSILWLRYPAFRPRWNWLFSAVWGYVGIVVITSLFGVNVYSSFWGTIERGEGIITLLHFALFFTMLPSVFRTTQDWYRYLMSATTITVVSGLYGLAQILNLSFVIHAGATRISGTIGNASFFAAFMLFGIFLALYLLQYATKKSHRVYLWSIFIFELFLLFESRTRGAILAVVGVFILYLVINIFKSKRKYIKFASVGGLALLLGFGVLIYANRDSAVVKSNNTLERLTTISRNDITTQSRLDTWGASWQGWKGRFLTGYGYENYNIAFNKFFPARIFKDQGSQVWFDRAHNIVFDQGVSGGVLGLLAYLNIFGVAFTVLYRLYRKNHPDVPWQGIALLGFVLIAYFGQNLFVFDTQATYLIFYLILAHLAFLQNNYLLKPKAEGRIFSNGWVIAVVIGILILPAMYFINLEPAMANYYTTQGIKAAKLKQYRDIHKLFKKSLSYVTYMDEEIRQRLVDYAREASTSNQLSPGERTDLFRYVIDELHKSIKASPLDVKNYLYLMSVQNQISTDQAVIASTFELGKKAVELSATRPQVYAELGQAAFLQKEYDKGLEYFRKAIELNPVPKESHFNFVLASLLAGRQDLADQELKIIQIDLPNKLGVSDYQALARVYAQIGNKLGLLGSYKSAVDLHPADPDLRAKLAAAYGELCDLDNARIQVSKVIELDQSFLLQGQEFLSQLEQKCKK